MTRYVFTITATLPDDEPRMAVDSFTDELHTTHNATNVEVTYVEVEDEQAPEFDMQPVESSNVRSVGWIESSNDQGFGTLRVEFANGGTYEYEGVTEANYGALLNAPSVGQHLAAYVKPHHEATKIS